MKNILKLEINSKHVDTSHVKGSHIMITPIMNDDYWMYRVKLSKNQSILGFGKFGVIGIGFAKEVDSNTNLPSGTDAEGIYNHIKKNKSDVKIKKENCLKAIRMIQEAVHEVLKRKTIDRLKKFGMTDVERLATVSVYLRQSNSYEIAQMFDQRDDIRDAFFKINS